MLCRRPYGWTVLRLHVLANYDWFFLVPHAFRSDLFHHKKRISISFFLRWGAVKPYRFVLSNVAPAPATRRGLL